MAEHLTKTVDVDCIRCADCEETIRREIGDLDGIDKVAAEHRKGRVRITYDPRRVRLRTVEERLEDLGFPLRDTRFARFKRGWQHFTEANELDNQRATAHCCNKPPPRG